MARKNTSEEVYQDIDEAGLILDLAAGVSTTLAAAAAEGDVTFTVDDATGLVAGDLVRVGSGNKLEETIVESVAVNVVTVRMPLFYDHAIGDAVVERQKIKHGEVSDQGVRVNSTINETKLKTATTRGTYVTLTTDTDHMISWATVNHALENLASSYGMGDAAIVTGSGGSRRLVVGTRNIRQLRNVTAYFVGTRHDGTALEIQGWDVDLGVSGDRTYTSGSGVPVQLGGACKALAHLEYA